MRKRKQGEPVVDDEDLAEMEIESEEKMEQVDGSIDDRSDVEKADEDMSDSEKDDDEAVEARATVMTTTTTSPFMDAFYGLSSANAQERAHAAQLLLHHCLVGPDANSKDAAYAFRRLLNGLCSGRAAARQGNASALASFLKLCFQLGKMKDIQDEIGDSSSDSLLDFVREKLIKTTDPGQITGKKKGHEERDYHFGRLFGILAMARSNILIPTSENEDEILSVATKLVEDLSGLFWLKKWMREPASHGISTLLNLFFSTSNTGGSSACKSISSHLIVQVIIPLILRRDRQGKEIKASVSSVVESFSAEQLAIAIHIQSNFEQDLPSPLDTAILSVENIPMMAAALADTSSVVQPRTHFVWDAMWVFLCKSDDDDQMSDLNQPARISCKSLRGSIDGEAAVDVVDLVVKEVVVKGLLRLGDDEVGKRGSKITHERRSLALSLIKILCGVPFVSSLEGTVRILLDPDTLQTVVLTPVITKVLFLDVLCAGNRGSQSSHTLKPLAQDVLRAMSASADESKNSDGNRQMAIAKALLACDVRFDARTKTSAVSDLLRFNQSVVIDEMQFKIWNEYLVFLEDHFVESVSMGEKASANVSGYIELLFGTTKSVIRLEAASEEDAASLSEFKQSVVSRVLSFFMTCAFFSSKTLAKQGKKATESVRKAASVVDSVPYSVRSIISARFFSLVSDSVSHAIHQVQDDGQQGKDDKMLLILTELYETQNKLDVATATKKRKPLDSMDEEEELLDPNSVVAFFQDQLEGIPEVEESQRRLCKGFYILALTLQLHLLSTKALLSDNDTDVELDEDDLEDEKEEIQASMDFLKSVMDSFASKEKDVNPLLSLTELCTNILSTSLGAGGSTRGASAKLVREAVKFAWLGGLNEAGSRATETESLMTTDVMNLLLDGIGATVDDTEEMPDGGGQEEGSDGDENEIEDDNEDWGAEGEGTIFSKAAAVLDDPEEDEDVETKDDADSSSDAEVPEMELDPKSLQSMLEEDIDDADLDNDLEHHEGADAALAKLIKLKQDARKAGRMAREKQEIMSYLRCFLLFETAMSRPEAWGQLFRKDVILDALVLMLKKRRSVDKTLLVAEKRTGLPASGEKKSYLEKLTTFIKAKLCKLRLQSLPCGKNEKEVGKSIAAEVYDMLRKEESKEQSSCLSASMILVLRAMSSTETQRDIASKVYEEAVRDWSTKRTTISTSLFSDLLSHIPRYE